MFTVILRKTNVVDFIRIDYTLKINVQNTFSLSKYSSVGLCGYGDLF